MIWRARGIDDAALAVRFERGFDSGFFLRRQQGRLVLDCFDDVAAGRQFAQLVRNVLAIPRHDSSGAAHAVMLVLRRET